METLLYTIKGCLIILAAIAIAVGLVFLIKILGPIFAGIALIILIGYAVGKIIKEEDKYR